MDPACHSNGRLIPFWFLHEICTNTHHCAQWWLKDNVVRFILKKSRGRQCQSRLWSKLLDDRFHDRNSFLSFEDGLFPLSYLLGLACYVSKVAPVECQKGRNKKWLILEVSTWTRRARRGAKVDKVEVMQYELKIRGRAPASKFYYLVNYLKAYFSRILWYYPMQRCCTYYPFSFSLDFPSYPLFFILDIWCKKGVFV